MANVIVVGGGIAGLASALQLLEKGLSVTVIARDLTPNTGASDKAAAFAYAFHVGVPSEERAINWIRGSINKFNSLSDERYSGVTFAPGVIGFDEPTPEPNWKDLVVDFRRPVKGELDPRFADGYSFRTPIIDMPIFMKHMMAKVVQMGGKFLYPVEVASPDADVLKSADVIVNCTGLGAREFVDDGSVFPIRGQLVIAIPPKSGPASEAGFFLAETRERGIEYWIRRFNDLIIGGTAEDYETDPLPSEQTAKRMIAKVSELYPELADLTVIGNAVGFRPGRKFVRVETEKLADGRIMIHNYGHGGAGVTLAFGCADEVADLAAEALGLSERIRLVG